MHAPNANAVRSRGTTCAPAPRRPQASLDDRPLKDRESGRPVDFAFVLYAR